MGNPNMTTVTEFIEIDLNNKKVTLPEIGIGNSQSAYRYLNNPVHNMIISLLQNVPLNRDTILRVPSQNQSITNPDCGLPCEWKSLPIPQYFSHAWLQGVKFKVGLVRNLDGSELNLDNMSFEDKSDNAAYRQMVRSVIMGLVSFPHRAEYEMCGYSNKNITVRPPVGPSDFLFQSERTTTVSQSNHEMLLFSISQCLSVNQCLTPIQFPNKYGIDLSFGDIILSKYHWNNTEKISIPTDSKVVLRIEYAVQFDFLKIFDELQEILINKGFDIATARDNLQFLYNKFSFSKTTIKQSINNLYASWVGSGEKLQEIYPIPSGKYKFYGHPTYIPTKARLVVVVPETFDHTSKMMLRMENNGEVKILKKIRFNKKISKNKRDSLIRHSNMPSSGNHGPVLQGYYHHKGNHIESSLEEHILTYKEKGPKINPHKVSLRSLAIHNNPHERFVSGESLFLVYWVPLENIPFDPKTQVTSDDPCNIQKSQTTTAYF